MNSKSKVFIMFLPIFLAGCSVMNSKFDCNVSSGGRCAPMGQINKIATQGAFHGEKYQSISKQTKEDYRYFHTFADAPVRSNESVQQI